MITRYTPKRKGAGKPPRLRGKPGEFYRSKENNQLYCCIMIFRLKSDPHIWVYLLEERKDIKDPSTAMSKLCELISGDEAKAMTGIIWEPLYSTHDALYRDMETNAYAFGDRVMVPAKDLKNRFVKISGGEISEGK